jgi:hypothetical protein
MMSEKSVLFILLFCDEGICPGENCDQRRMSSMSTMTMKAVRSKDEQKKYFVSSPVLQWGIRPGNNCDQSRMDLILTVTATMGH